MKINYAKSVQYLCAVALIVTSIILVFIQESHISDVTNGVLMYVAQAFLLAVSIFGLDYYVKKLNHEIEEKIAKRNAEQQPA